MSDKFFKRIEGLYENLDYSNVEYVNISTHVNIKCITHNHEYSQRPIDHYRAKGCALCAAELHVIPKDDWINACKKQYPNNRYNHLIGVEFQQSSSIEVECLKHGMYTVNAGNHFRGKGNCLKCVGRYKRTIDELLFDMNQKHSHAYTYGDIPDGWSLSTKINIKCNQCDENFNQSIKNHSMGSGCPICAQTRKGWSRSSFLKAGSGRDCTFYVLKCYDDEEVFYKLGITSRTVKQRYAQKSAMPYNYEIINSIQSDALTIWNIEKIFMKQLEKYKYTPNIFFDGSIKECYKF